MKRTTLAYVLALSLIALLAVATHTIVDAVVVNMEDGAEVINVSGRQRMLSQRIAGYSERLATLPDGPEAENVKATLASSIDLMGVSHQVLIDQTLESSSGSDLENDPIYQIYRGEPHHLGRRVRDYLDAAQALLDLPSERRSGSEYLAHIRLEAERPLLAALDAAVTAYQTRSEQQVDVLRRILLALLVVLLGALVLEALLIFRPMIRRLEKEVERADTASAQKTAFLANMSHEIRTPLGGMIGLTELILEEPNSPKTAAYAQRLKEAGRHLLSVVNDILDFTKIAAGKLTLTPEAFRLRNLADAVQATFGPSIEQKGVRLVIDCPVDRMIVGDEFRLRQVIFNLLGNALKATKEGEISLRLAISSEAVSAGSSVTLSIEVSDTGTGMPDDMLQKLFEPYVQAQPASGGTGLGLVICRDLVRIMGGDIHITSSLGYGTQVFISVPTEDAGNLPEILTEPSATSVRAAPANMKILVADDDDLNRMLIEAALSKYGYTVTTVSDGNQALASARAETFDAIILDIQMPALGGLEALEVIRAEGLERGRPVIALTADVVPENVDRYLAAGFTACLSKPFDWNAIDRAIRGST